MALDHFHSLSKSPSGEEDILKKHLQVLSRNLMDPPEEEEGGTKLLEDTLMWCSWENQSDLKKKSIFNGLNDVLLNRPRHLDTVALKYGVKMQ